MARGKRSGNKLSTSIGSASLSRNRSIALSYRPCENRWNAYKLLTSFNFLVCNDDKYDQKGDYKERGVGSRSRWMETILTLISWSAGKLAVLHK